MRKKLRKNLRNQSGVAIMIALFAIMIMTFVAVEISYETSVEYVVSNSDYHKVRAYYAAKSGVELGLLRIQLFRNVLGTYGEQLKNNVDLLNNIWKLPFTWPPLLPEDLTRVNRDEINESVSESLMVGNYDIRIESEGNKIDLNDLDSMSKVLRENTRKALIQLIQNRIDQEDDWAKENRNLDIEELINNITDWVDNNEDSLNGGAERNKYSDYKSEFIPPNRPFKTFQEIRMVDGMTDEIFDILIPNVTIFGTKGINVNTASKEILMSIHSTITEEIANEILGRINDPNEGPFANFEDFKSFIGNQVNIKEIEDSGIPLYFGAEYNFRITSIGSYSKSQSKIIAIVYDFDTVKERLKDFLSKEDNQGGQPAASPTPVPSPTAGNPNQPETKKQKPLAGKPQVVYWYEE